MTHTPAAGGRTAARVRRALVHLLGIAVVLSVELGAPRPHALASVACGLGIGAWLALAFGRRMGPGLRWGVVVVMLAAGAAGTAAGSAGSTVIMGTGIASVLTVHSRPLRSTVPALAAAAVAFGAAWFATGARAVDPATVLFPVAFGGLIGLLLRQSARERQHERQVMQQQAQTAVIAERARLARDLHDVLAHSLGGLVIQLDAIDAIAGDPGADGAVRTRIRAARDMAAEGLADAKDAVDALRGFPWPVDAALAELARRARSMGERLDYTVSGDPRAVPPEQSDVIVSVLVQALSNAREHAAHTPVSAFVHVGERDVTIRVGNTLPAGGNARGGGRPRKGQGILGMMERMELIGGTLTAGEDSGEWVVEGRAARV